MKNKKIDWDSGIFIEENNFKKVIYFSYCKNLDNDDFKILKNHQNFVKKINNQYYKIEL